MEEIMFPNKLKGALLGAILSLAFCCAIFAEGFAESVSPGARSRYLANNGIILAPEDIYTDSYLASYNYGYPEPETDIGVNIYNKLNQTIPLGRDHLGPEGIIQVGIQGKTWGFAELPPLNLVFVVDTSISMNDDNKLFWFKTSMGNFIKKIRSIDSLSLVSFSNSAQVVFEPTLMDSMLKRRAFLDAVEKLYPQGLTNLEAGVSLGYEQIVPYYRENSINQILLFSDGDEFSARLARSNVRTGDIRISLMWNNRNDLDLHVITPMGEEINFNNPRDSYGGVLDVDRNLYGETLKAVENIFWPDNAAPQGRYRVYIQNYLNHETDPYPTPFQVEIKNGKEYLYFEGSVRGSGRSSITEICTFEYTGNDALDRLQQMVETRKQQGIFLSTIGLGRNFDAEFLRSLAEHGQGASRGLRSGGEVDGLLNTDREFERVAVPGAEDLDIELEFTPGIEIVEVLGYRHSRENNRVICRINRLYQGDYKTLFVRYRIPPQNRGLQVAALHIKTPQGSSAPEVGLYTDGNTTPGMPGSFEQVVVLTDPVNDFAEGMLRRSGAVLDFANAVREIAAHYYNRENDLTRLESALQISYETGRKLETLKQSLRNDEAFDPELSVIAKYIEILNDRIAENRRSFVNETPSRMLSGREGSFSRMTR
jgi:Ca-activated chloride channel family protein